MSAARRWLPDLTLGAVVALVGLFESINTDYFLYSDRAPALILVSVGVGAAVACSRHAPAVAFVLVWAVCGLQLLAGTTVLLTELAVAVVAFGTARWGSRATVVVSGLSIPLAAAAAVWFLSEGNVIRVLELDGVSRKITDSYQYGDTWQFGASVVGLAVLGLPWLAGLAFRYSDRARRSQESQEVAEAQRDQAEEIADLREEQARLARDVHDVVGHSLAVILAQAESAQYLKDADTTALKTTMANIATSARTSLQDVRQVLTNTGGATSAPDRTAGLDSLVDGVRASGHAVASTEVGTPQPLPPELEVVAFRVLQEMLTNAIKHGQRDQPVLVERHWEGELRIEVRNVIDTSDIETQPLVMADPIPEHRGQGLEGMRRRLEAVGGRLDVRRRVEAGGPTFTATAWVPVRSR